MREAVLNAVCHRDYGLNGSVFVRQYGRRLEVVSPGGFPSGVTPENILDQQNPRNRRLAEALEKCGLIERAGQGMNLMFERCVQQSKPIPDFAGTADHEVWVTLAGTVTNPGFVRFLEKIGQELSVSFNTRDLLFLDHLQRGVKPKEPLRGNAEALIDAGVIESVGRGRGRRYLLSRRFYSAIGQRGTYTRRRGLDREAHKQLLLQHLQLCGPTGSAMSELEQVVPALSRSQVRRLLKELESDGGAHLQGTRRWARWYVIVEAMNQTVSDDA